MSGFFFFIKRKPKRMTTLKFLNFRENPYPGLWPAPNVREMDEIDAELAKDTMPKQTVDPEQLTNKEFKILTDYRGSLLFLEGGLRVYRTWADGVNGYAYFPVKGQREEVKIGNWYADAEYI